MYHSFVFCVVVILSILYSYNCLVQLIFALKYVLTEKEEEKQTMATLRLNRFNNLLTKTWTNNLHNISLYRNTIRLSTSKQSSGNKEMIVSDFCVPAAAYSAATKGNGFIFVSGQLGIDPKTKKFISDDVQSQTKQALINLKGIVDDAGSELNKVTKTTVLLSDINDFASVNQVYLDFFKESKVTELPARAAYAVANLPLNAKVEIEAVALE